MKNAIHLSAAGLLLTMASVTMQGRAQSVSTDYNHQADFSQYHTFSLYKVQATDPLVDERIKDAIRKDLTAKGLQEASTGADLNVTAIESTKDKQEYNTFYDGLGGSGYGWGGWGGWGGRWGGGGMSDASTTVTTVPVGTLMVDLYDAKTHQLQWRGTAHEDLRTRPRKTPPS